MGIVHESAECFLATDGHGKRYGRKTEDNVFIEREDCWEVLRRACRVRRSGEQRRDEPHLMGRLALGIFFPGTAQDERVGG